MDKQKPEDVRQLSFDDIKKASPGWQIVVQPIDNGHVRVISTKRPPDAKKG